MSSVPEFNMRMFIHNNKYGYRICISDKDIHPLYILYKQENNLPLHFPISDNERFEFEEQLINVWKKRVEEHKKVGDENEQEKTAI